MQIYKRRMPGLYALVEEQFGPDKAPELFLHFVQESARMNHGGSERPGYAYVAMRRYLRDQAATK